VAGGLVGVLLLGIAGSAITQQIEIAAAEEKARLAAESITEAFPADVLDGYVACDPVSEAISGVNVDGFNSIVQLATGITDSRQAKSIVSSNAIVTPTAASDFEQGVSDAIDPSFQKIMNSEDRAKDVEREQESAWAGQWTTYILSQCKLETDYRKTLGSLRDGTSKIQALISLAATAPWYPEGWNLSPTDDAIAWSWVDSSTLSCSRCAIWAINVVAESGCSSVYAELNITSNDVVIDWTNSSLSALASGQTGYMEFTRYPYQGGLRGKITELTCHY
jgi:hypothetical protein